MSDDTTPKEGQQSVITELFRGDVVRACWVDPQGAEWGDPGEAELATRLTTSCYWGLGWDKASGEEIIILSSTEDTDPAQQGWFCAPIKSLREIRLRCRARHKGRTVDMDSFLANARVARDKEGKA